jgi:hypothetical protein
MKSIFTILVITTVSFSLLAQRKPATDSIKNPTRSATSVKAPEAPKTTSNSQQILKAYKAIPYWKKLMDSLKVQQIELKSYRTKFASLESENVTLTARLRAANDSLLTKNNRGEVVSTTESSTSVPMNDIVWGILGLLIIGLGVTIYMSVSAKKEAKYRIALFEDLSKDYQTYKLKSNEKEKKLSRELQTERNKLEDLLNKR